MSKLTYCLQIVYPAQHYPKGDHTLEELLGSCSASGMGFGERDLSWYFKTVKAMDKKLELTKNLDSMFKIDSYSF